MEPRISIHLITLDTAKEVWLAVSHLFSGEHNIIRIYQLFQDLFRLGDKNIEEYYSALKNIMNNLNDFQPFSTNLTI